MTEKQTMDARTRLTRTAYLIGVVGEGPLGHVTFRPNGRVTSWFTWAQYRFSLDAEGRLSFRTPLGKVTAVLSPGADGGYVPHRGTAFYLQPLFSLGPPPASDLPPVFVNTVPKSGTYLVARALENIGYRNSGLHAMDEYFHDNRGVDEAEIHWAPETREQTLPAHVVAALLAPGEFAVGHVGTRNRMQGIERAGVRLVNVLREPRSLLLSMFVFKAARVKPTPADRIWQGMEGLDAFKAFLLVNPVADWMAHTRVVAENYRFLRYEDLRRGEVARAAVGRKLSKRLPAGLKAALGTKTSTYIPGDRSALEAFVQDPDVIAYLEAQDVISCSETFWPQDA